MEIELKDLIIDNLGRQVAQLSVELAESRGENRILRARLQALIAAAEPPETDTEQVDDENP